MSGFMGAFRDNSVEGQFYQKIVMMHPYSPIKMVGFFVFHFLFIFSFSIFSSVLLLLRDLLHLLCNWRRNWDRRRRSHIDLHLLSRR